MAKDLTFEKGLPANPDAEKLVLGSVLLDGNQFPEVREILGAEDFSLEKHRRIWNAIDALYTRHGAIDRITVAGELASHNQLEAVDGITYLVELDNGLPRISHLEPYARMVLEKSLLRQIAYVMQKVQQRALLGEDSAERIAADGLKELQAIGNTRRSGTLRSVAEIVSDAGGMDAFVRESWGIRSPWPAIDNYTTGFKPGELTVVAGLTASGKSAMLHQIAEHAADKQGAAVVVFSLEMSAREVVARMVSGRSGWSKWQLSHETTMEMRGDYVRAAAELSKLPLRIEDSCACSLLGMRNCLRSMERGGAPLLVVVDYLQIMTTANRQENRAQAVAELSRGLKLLARELDASVIVASQFRRGTQDREPTLEDLKESSGIEQDADRVFLLQRKAKTLSHNQPVPFRLLIAKQRNGPSACFVELQFIPRLARFYELTQDGEQKTEQRRFPDA